MISKRWLTMIGIPLITFLVTAACGISINGFGRQVRGSGNVTTETRQVSGFDEINVCCGMQLILTQGQSESLEIEAEDNLLPEIVSNVVGGRLTVRFKDTNGGTRYRPTESILVRVSAVNVKGVEISGGGRLETEALDTEALEIELSGGSQGEIGTVKGTRLRANLSGGSHLTAADLQAETTQLDLSGSSEVEVDRLEGDRLEFDASGGGESRIEGSVQEQVLNLNGGAGLVAGDLESETASVEMSGGGSATLWVKETLDADLSGGCRLDLYGTPAINDNLSGGSEINDRGEK